jgi:hypothetical protein
VVDDAEADGAVVEDDFELPLLHATAHKTSAHSIATLGRMTSTMI